MAAETGEPRQSELTADPGSFRDRSNRVFRAGDRILRGVSADALRNWEALLACGLAGELQASGQIVKTEIAPPPGGAGAEHWAGFLSHELIPFVSYPYEWSFEMLKDAALLHLDILEQAIPRGWTLKDASGYNVQWKNAKPVFIDIPSFEPYRKGESWQGYRQFCMMFLFPLMLKAYKEIDFASFLRSNLDGIDPLVASRLLSDRRSRKGVFSHVYLHAQMQARAAKRELAEAKRLTETAKGELEKATSMRHSLAMVLGTIDDLKRTVRKLSLRDEQTTWGNYDTDHSYSDASFEAKKAFVARHAGAKHRRMVWDMGCNTGSFSRVCEPHADVVISMDGDAKAVDRLYRYEKTRQVSKLLPLIIDLGNVSPNQGWRGAERKALDKRGYPELVLCLALIHHIVITANIPMDEFIGWLHDLGGDVVIEFVSAEDDMSRMLLRNKINQYQDYTKENFERLASQGFVIEDSLDLKGGHRTIYFLRHR
jgi:hypothetical protein